jgi:hypothetical protein
LAYSERLARIRKPDKGKSSKPSDVEKTKTCDECYAVYEANLNECPMCGHINESTRKKIEHERGELIRVQEKELLISRMRNDLFKLSNPNWKPVAKWIKLYEIYGEKIFDYKKELEIPRWVRAKITRVTQRDTSKSSRKFY